VPSLFPTKTSSPEFGAIAVFQFAAVVKLPSLEPVYVSLFPAARLTETRVDAADRRRYFLLLIGLGALQGRLFAHLMGIALPHFRIQTAFRCSVRIPDYKTEVPSHMALVSSELAARFYIDINFLQRKNAADGDDLAVKRPIQTLIGNCAGVGCPRMPV
jgi:hypothetical protein